MRSQVMGANQESVETLVVNLTSSVFQNFEVSEKTHIVKFDR